MKLRYLLILTAACLLVLAIYILMRPAEASLLLINGKVYTVDDKQPIAEALAIRGGRIAAVGTTEHIRSTFRAAHTIDLAGMTVVPGFVDAHAHVENLGVFLMNLNLLGTSSIEEIQHLVQENVAQAPAGAWIRGRGWDQNRWPGKEFPHRRYLDAVAGALPVYLERVDGHAVWVNTAVLAIAGITADIADPPGGRFVRDTNGELTGVIIDNAVDTLDARLPDPGFEERLKAFELAGKTCIELGLTQVHDMGVDLEGMEIYRTLLRQGRFPLRVYAVLQGREAWKDYAERGPEIGAHGGYLTVRALKLYVDGALGSRGAALIEPYADDPGNRGLTLTSADDLLQAAKDASQRGFQMCTHAIGDRGNHIVLNVYQQVLKSSPGKGKDLRFRVEHAQVVDPKDIPRFAELGVLPSMQPTHCTSDMYWAQDRLGPSRLDGAYAWRSFLNHGSIIPAGSDFPVESPNPLWGFYAAITRQDHDGWPEGGWMPEQRMTRAEALKAFTIWAAYASFEEREKGSLEPGKVADIVVLSDDIMTIEPARVLNTRVEMTMVGGTVAYSAGRIQLPAADTTMK